MIYGILFVESPRKEIVYYQWIPLVLFLQAILFFLPSMFWAALNHSVGMDMNAIVKTCKNIDNIDPCYRDKVTKYLAQHFDRYVHYSRQISTTQCAAVKAKMADLGCICGKRYGNYLVVVYLFIKMLYIGNVILQLYLLNYFLGTDYVMYGFEVMRDLSQSGTYKESPRFPRVTLCDFNVRSFGKTKPHTVQCTLPINLFNEKIFIWVWFWLTLVGVANVVSFTSWMWVMFARNRRAYIKRYLKSFDKFDKKTGKIKIGAFCERYLRVDGYFILQMISKNSSELVVGELITLLWVNFDRKTQHLNV